MSEITTIWFTSDHHIGHATVAELRGFSVRGEMEEVLAERWDAVIQTGDQVWVLGDTCVIGPEAMFAWFQARPGRKQLIMGNHDRIFSGHRGAYRVHRDDGWHETFESIQSFARIKVLGEPALLSHFPYPGHSEGTDADGRPYDDRYAQYRLPNLGIPLIHGHTHRNERLSYNAMPAAPGTRGSKLTPQVHIGLDAWNLCPVPLTAVEDILRPRSLTWET